MNWSDVFFFYWVIKNKLFENLARWVHIIFLRNRKIFFPMFLTASKLKSTCWSFFFYSTRKKTLQTLKAVKVCTNVSQNFSLTMIFETWKILKDPACRHVGMVINLSVKTGTHQKNWFFSNLFGFDQQKKTAI